MVTSVALEYRVYTHWTEHWHLLLWSERIIKPITLITHDEMTERVINTLPGKKAESINLFAFDSDRITFVFTDDFSSII